MPQLLSIRLTTLLTTLPHYPQHYSNHTHNACPPHNPLRNPPRRSVHPLRDGRTRTRPIHVRSPPSLRSTSHTDRFSRDYSDPPLRTTSIAKKRAFTEDDMRNIAMSLTARALTPVQRYGEYGYNPAEASTREGLQQIMDSEATMGMGPC